MQLCFHGTHTHTHITEKVQLCKLFRIIKHRTFHVLSLPLSSGRKEKETRFGTQKCKNSTLHWIIAVWSMHKHSALHACTYIDIIDYCNLRHARNQMTLLSDWRANKSVPRLSFPTFLSVCFLFVGVYRIVVVFIRMLRLLFFIYVLYSMLLRLPIRCY